MKHAVVAGLLIVISIVAQAATVDVTVGPGLSFTPSSVNINVGDTVRWTWAGALHTSTSNTTTGAEVWNSGLKSSGTFSHTFTNAGNWPYYCSLHSFPGGTAMNGVVRVTSAAPTLTSINPTAGPTAGGTNVTLSGSNFSAGCSATFGGTPATANNVQNATTMTATTPAHPAGVVSVAVVCPGGTSTLTNAFTFAPPPIITGVQPSSSAPGTQVTITGSGFQNGAAVLFGTAAASAVTFVDSATLLAIVPLVPAGPVTITVTNPDTQTTRFVGFVSLGPEAIPLFSGKMLLLLIAAFVAIGAAALRSRV